MKLYLLDRNIISHISEGFKRCTDSDAVRIKDLDKKGNIVSFMLSSLEGNSALPQTPTQVFDGTTADLEKAKGFFKKARLDSNFLKKYLIEASLAFSERQQEIFTRYFEITKFLQDTLYQSIAAEDLTSTREAIAVKAKETGTPFGHTIVLCGLAALYGYVPARKALKCRKPNASETENNRKKRIYNAISDLMTISNVGTILDTHNRLQTHQKPQKRLSVKFITLDKDLDAILSKLTINKTSSFEDMAGDRNTFTEYSPCMSMFPRITSENQQEFLDWLDKNQ